MPMTKDQLFTEIQRRIEKDNNGYKASVPAKEMLAFAYGESLPKADVSFEDIKSNLRKKTEEIYKEYINNPLDTRHIRIPVDNSFNNCNGQWTEYVFDVFAWNTLCDINKSESKNVFVYVKLPNRNKEFWSSLLAERPRRAIEEKENTLSKVGAALESSNPDAVILYLDKSEFENYDWNPCTRMDSISRENQDILDSVYNVCAGKVHSANQLVAFLSVKSSTRADRRYQWIVEGNSSKGLYAVAFREEDKDKTLGALMRNKFFAFSFDKPKNADNKALTNLIMFASLFNQETIGQTYAIDALYNCSKPEEIIDKIAHICNINSK